MTPLGFLLRPRSSTGTAYPIFLFFPRNKEERAEASGEEKEGKRRGERRSFVCGPAGVLGQLGRGVALCVVCHGVLRRVETSHAKRYKHEEAREFRTHASHNVRNGGLCAKPPREMLEGPWAVHSLFFVHSSRYSLDVITTLDIWNLVRCLCVP